eukprot:COSAG02_NODE_13031_length_1457_cov_1.656112_2_plen_161_part_00
MLSSRDTSGAAGSHRHLRRRLTVGTGATATTGTRHGEEAAVHRTGETIAQYARPTANPAYGCRALGNILIVSCHMWLFRSGEDAPGATAAAAAAVAVDTAAATADETGSVTTATTMVGEQIAGSDMQDRIPIECLGPSSTSGPAPWRHRPDIGAMMMELS